MIYIYNQPGRKGYTNLGEMVDYRRASMKDKHGYEQLKNMVKKNALHYKENSNSNGLVRKNSTISILYNY
jgi:hypothetical protein